MNCLHCQEPLGEKRVALTLPGCTSCAPAPVDVCEACFRALGSATGQVRVEMLQRIQLALMDSEGCA